MREFLNEKPFDWMIISQTKQFPWETDVSQNEIPWLFQHNNNENKAKKFQPSGIPRTDAVIE